MVLTSPVPGQETFNAQVLVEAGAAVQTHSVQEAVDQVAALLADPSRRDQLARNARHMLRPSTQMICQRILQAVNSWEI